MLRFEVPNVYFDIFNNNNCDHLMVPSRQCGTNWWADYDHHWPLESYYFADLKPKKSHTVPVKPVTKLVPFKTEFDVSSFDPSEVSVKLDDKYLTVECTQERKAVNGHFEYRHFVKKVPIPVGCLTEQMQCKLDQNGLLLVEAPVKTPVETEKMEAEPAEKMEVSQMEVQQQSTEAPVTEPPKPKESQPEVVIEDIGPEF